MLESPIQPTLPRCSMCNAPAKYRVKNAKGIDELLCFRCTLTNQDIEKHKPKKI